MDMTGLFFFAGGMAMLVHIALCALLVRGLANNGAAKEALMAIPNRPLAQQAAFGSCGLVITYLGNRFHQLLMNWSLGYAGLCRRPALPACFV
jgi:hypothetical protein